MPIQGVGPPSPPPPSSSSSCDDRDDAAVVPPRPRAVVIVRLANARILRRDGSLLHGSIDVSSATGLVVAVDVDGGPPTGGEEEGGRGTRDRDDDHADDDRPRPRRRLAEKVADMIHRGQSTKQNFTYESSHVVVDCRGLVLSPGFVDLQLNGAYGVDFSSVSSTDDDGRGLVASDVLRVARRLVETGVTSFCPTMVSSSRATYRRSMNAINEAREGQRESRRRMRRAGSVDGAVDGANILGMHLEGPFFAPTRNGAHDPSHVVSPSGGMASVVDVYGLSTTTTTTASAMPTLDNVDIVTLAPELPGACDVIRSLTGRFDRLSNHDDDDDGPQRRRRRRRRRRPVVVSLGHTEATYEDGTRALSCGATFVTHLYNAMEPFHHRAPGLHGLLSSPCALGRMGLERPHYGIIVDGVHVHECAVRMAYRAHPVGCVLVTDAMAAMGLDDDDDDGGGGVVVATLGSVGVVRSPGGDRAVANDGTGKTLAGSVAPMDECVRRFRTYVDCPIGGALLCATLHPATVLGRHVVVGRGRGRGRGRGGSDVADGDADDDDDDRRGDNGDYRPPADYDDDNDDAPIGILEAGARADVVMLDDDLVVHATWVGGRLAYQRGSGA